MENWYLPITIVPGIGLLILSTSNLMLMLSSEINTIINNKSGGESIISRKLSQLKLLNRSMVFFYIAVACLVSSGLITGLNTSIVGSKATISIYISIVGIIIFLLGLISLIIYSYRAVRIRQEQFKNTFN
jgi:uncharacterized BrkB/YihY/UPF0761 family membrane protein